MNAPGTPAVNEPGPSVLIMARAPRRGEVRRALEEVLGADCCFALQAALIVEAVRWAREVAGENVHVAHDPPDAGPELRRLLGASAPAPQLFPQNGEGISGRLADAAGRVYGHGGGGPLLIVWPDLPRMRSEHAEAALEDLSQGADVSLGPVYDGGFYLVAIPRPLPSLFGLSEQVWRSADAMAISLAAARDAGLEIGLLRAERGMHRPADVRAALADPTLPEPVARILRRARFD
jgi:glycosyltransferase A (GT-A) superfamily protein (DUF2064 family)